MVWTVSKLFIGNTMGILRARINDKKRRKKIISTFFFLNKNKNYPFEVHVGEFGIKFTFSKNILFYV